MNHPVLPLQTRGARCGYCERPLTLQPAGDWACAHCKPLLAKVATIDDYKRFCAERAAKEKRRAAAKKARAARKEQRRRKR